MYSDSCQVRICEYISLGSDCSVSYQLRKYGLQSSGSMPLDWCVLSSMDTLISILDNKFSGFTDFKEYVIKPQSDNFDNFDCKDYKSRCKMIHSKYKGLTLPHEYLDTELDIPEFENKYSRRIKRFNEIVINPNIEKVFIRFGNNKEKDKRSILEEALDRYGAINYTLKHIIIDDYNHLIPKKEPFRWQRDYIPWIELFSK